MVAAGTEHYQDSDELTSVPEDVQKMAGFFGRLGYREQLPEIRHDPGSQALRRALSEWLNGPDRQATDTAVIYYSGHGDSQANLFYLLTADSQENRYADTALRADYVLEALGETPKVRRVLLILDACYAGQGAFNAADVAARMSPWQNFRGDDEGVWVVAAASPKQEAQERLFTDAFLAAAGQLEQTTGTLQPYIGLEALIEQINAILRHSGKKQRVSWIPVTQARGLAPFIPNPNYEPDAPANVDLETRNWLRRRRAAELAEYWGPKARGVEVAAQAGWYFTGRQAALTELAGWLADPSADSRLRVLTGDPGSGKSAVLGRLVTLADPSSAAKPPGTTADPSSVPPAGSITAALLAKGKTGDELLGELAAGLDVPPGAELAAALLKRPVFTVVIDALDEASDPPSVIQKVISPLHGAASPGRGPRLLVATRRYEQLLGSLPAARAIVDLDQDAYSNEGDVAGYVTKVLLATSDPDSPTPYRDQPKLASQVASQVAAIAGHSFLIAQIAARTLAHAPRALDPAEVSADRQRWHDVGAAFDRDLDRYGEQAHRVRDLLTPLAWAEGAGLPRELWAPLATALTDDENYTDDDITWLLEQAAFYLVEALDQGRSVYRLYHQQFAEYLWAAHTSSTAQQRITAELMRHVPVAAAGRREWLAAPPYIQAHLATHAGRGGVLDQLVTDPGFLLAADPGRLQPALATVSDPQARQSASAFESTRYLLRGQPPGQAAAQLDLAAQVHGATILADGISQLPFPRPWTITWGHWPPPHRNIVLARDVGWVKAVAVGVADGIPVAVGGGTDGTVRIWDLRTGAATGVRLAGHTGQVTAVAVGVADGIPVAVGGGTDGTVRVWDLRTGAPRGEPAAGHTGQVTAVAVGVADGIPVAVSGGHDGTVRVWDLRTGAATGVSLAGYTGWLTAVAVGVADGTPVAVSGGHDGTVRVWDLRTGAPRGKPFIHRRGLSRLLHGHSDVLRGIVQAVAVGDADGTPVAVSGGRDGTVRVWDLRTGAARGKPFAGQPGQVTALAVGVADGIPVAVSGGHYTGWSGTLRVWDLRTGAATGVSLRRYTGGVTALAVGVADGTPVAVSYGYREVRVWDLRTGTARGEPPTGHTGPVTAVAVGVADGTPVAVSGGSDGTVRVWDLRTGAARGEPFAGHTSPVNAVAVGEVDGTPVAVSGSDGSGGGWGGMVRVWDLRTGAARGKLRPGLGSLRGISETLMVSVSAVAVGEVDGTPVAVSSSSDGWNSTVRVWDLRTGAARGEPLAGHTRGVTALAVGVADGTPVAVSGSSDGTVRVWDLRTGAARGEPFAGHTSQVNAVAVGEVDGTPVAVSGGDGSGGGWSGTVRVWDLRTGAARGEPLAGHTGPVTAVAVGEIDGTPVAVSGDRDGTILLWALDQGQCISARLDAPSGVRAIAAAGRAGWLIGTEDGSLFLWVPAIGTMTRAT